MTCTIHFFARLEMQAADPKTLVPDLPGNRLVLSKLITRNTWLQTATLLFELNFMQESKEMLQEVLQQAKVSSKRAFISPQCDLH